MIQSARIARETGREYALRTIKENIIHLHLAPGSKVSENELAAEMGISRTPVREALIELSRVGIVEIFPQRGSFISLIDYDLVEEAQFMRETLECAVVERCCEKGLTDEQRRQLQENLDLQAFYIQNRSQQYIELDDQFHHSLFVITNLLQVYQLMNSMTVHFDRVRALSIIAVKEIKVVEDHQKVLNAIIAQNAEEAKAVMHKHLNRYLVDREVVGQLYPQYMK